MKADDIFKLGQGFGDKKIFFFANGVQQFEGKKPKRYRSDDRVYTKPDYKPY